MSEQGHGAQVALEADLEALAARVAKLEASPASVGSAGPEGPQGPKGDPGPVGPQGPSGKDGAQAPASIDDFLGALKALLLGGTSTAPASTPAASQDHFPLKADGTPDYNNATRPSPEGSTSRGSTGGKIVGAPYLIMQSGALWDLVPQPDGTFKVRVDGVETANSGYNAITIVGGRGYVTYDGGHTGVFESPDSVNSGIWQGPIPAVGSVPAPGTPATPAVLDVTDPAPASPAPGSSGKVIEVAPGGFAAAGNAAGGSGDTIKLAPGVYNESVGIAGAAVEGGGKVTNPGSKDATYAAGAVLDATGLAGYREGQGGVVLLGDSIIRGLEVTKFGAAAPGHDGTGGIRNNRDGTFLIEDCYIHHNQMGIGPHGGGKALMHLKNSLFLNNGLPQDPGYAHNIYSYATHTLVEGVTSIVEANNGDGHAGKFAGPVLEVLGKNYFRAWNTSCIDIPHGTAKPFVIKADGNGGTIIEKLDGDDNHVLLGYGTESQNNGNAGGTIDGATFIVPNNGQQYLFLTSGPITPKNCKFLYSDGSPAKSSSFTVQGGGIVTGLPA